MENQVPADEVKENFDRLLHVVQEVAKQRAARFSGQEAEVLVEDVNEHDSRLVTGRLSCNMLVHFPGGRELIGQYTTVRLEECKGFYYMGHAVSDPNGIIK